MTVYDLRGGEKTAEVMERLNEKFKDGGVVFKSCIITSVWLHEDLAHYLEQTTEMELKKERIERQNEYEMLQIRQESEMQVEEIKRKTEQVLVTEAGRKKRSELEFEQNSVKTEEAGRVAMIEAETTTEVDALEVNAKKVRIKNESETQRVTAIAKADADAIAMRIHAETAAVVEKIKAECQEADMVADANVVKFEATAEKEASHYLVAQRKHELETREKGVLKQMAQTGTFNLVGDSGDKILQAMMSGAMKK